MNELRPIPAPMPSSEGTEANIGDLWRTLVRRRRMLAGVSVGVAAVVMLITLAIPPIYESEAVLRIRSDSPDGAGMLEDMLPMGGAGALSSLPGLGESDVATEVGVLQSRRIREWVADSLALHVDLVQPFRRPRSDVLEVLDAGADAVRGYYTLRRQDDGSYTASSFWTREPITLPGPVTIGEPFEIANVRLELIPELAADPPGVVRFQVSPFQRVVSDLEDDLHVARQDSRSQLIEVAYRHRDARIAAGVVNGAIDQFLDYSRGAEKYESRREVEILSEQVAEYRARLDDVERSLEEYQEQEGIVAPEEQAEQAVVRIAEVQVEYDALQIERAAIARLLAQIAASESAPNAQPPYRQLSTYPSFIGNSAVQDVLDALTELENERSELLGRRTEANSDVQVLTARIQELQDGLYAMGANYIQGLNNQIASAGATLQEFATELATLPAVQIEYARRRRDQELLSEIYLLLEGRLSQAMVQEAIDDSNARIVDNGIIADRPAFPRPLISLVLASILGLMAGVFTVVAYETANPSVRSRRDAERAAPGVPVLGVIPRVAGIRPPQRIGGRAVKVGPLVLRGSVPPNVDSLVARNDPWHPAAESYRAIATNLFGNGADAPRLLVVTSALPEEGKTTVAANLAVTLARNGHNTLLVDADLRAGELATLFGIPAEPGWPETVLGGGDLTQIVREVTVADSGATLDLLPAGSLSIHPAELLGSESVRRTLAALRDRYDAIILDTPPLNSAFDAAVLGAIADGTLLVARSGSTGRQALEDATAELHRARAPIAGVALNQFESSAPKPSYSGKYNGTG